MIKDIRFIEYVINVYTNLPKLLRDLNIDIRVNGQMFCPFHDNYVTEAAKIYKDSGGYCIYCFYEHRIYRSFDVVRDIMKQNVYVVFNTIWNSLTDKMKKDLVESFGELDTNTITVPCLKELDDFRQGRISYDNLLDFLNQYY